MHVPTQTVEQAMAVVTELAADCSVSLGGGSTTGLGKALALRIQLPNIVIPTTYAGSEMTNIWGITENERKLTGRDNVVVPTHTLYDPKLTLGLPAKVAGPSGLNAMAQAVVNVTPESANPVVFTALSQIRLWRAAVGRVGCLDEHFISLPPFPWPYHPARRVALLPVHTQPPRCRGSDG